MGDDYKSFLIQAFTLLVIVVFTVVLLLFLIKFFLKGVSGDNTTTYIEFAKWAAVSIALIIIATIFDNNFKDRDAGLNEIKQYDSYVNLVVLNDRVGPKWRLSQYFSKVTASDKLRKRWEDYFELVDREYKDSLVERENAKRRQDSLAQVINRNPNVDTTIKILFERSKERVENLNSELDTKVNIVPASGGFAEAADWEKKGFDFLFNKDVMNAIEAFGNADKAFPTIHNAHEIKNLLYSRQDKLMDKNSPEWKEVYSEVYKMSKWYLDKERLTRLNDQ